MDNKKKILVFCYTGLGNLILKIPLFKSLKKNYPFSQIDIISGNIGNFHVEDDFFLVRQELINRIHIISEKDSFYNRIKKLRSLSKEKYELILMPFDGAPLTYKLLSFIFSCPKIIHYIIYPKKKILSYIKIAPFFLLPRTYLVKYDNDKHETFLNLDLLNKDINFNKEYIDSNSRLSELKIKTTNVIKKFGLIETKYIIIQPMAADGNMTAKVWAPKNYFLLIQELRRVYPKFKIVIVGQNKDQEKINHHIPLISDLYLNLIGKTDINELIELVNNASLVISNDSSIMHIASALDKNQVALYGPTDIKRTRPTGKNSVILSSKNKYLHAMQNFYFSEKELSKRFPNYELMNKISTKDIMDQIHLLKFLD
tara:strand:+ start:7854 stop:8963 length:1110 start_codon:yes stop_codon:yes gene_type:complete